MTTKSTIDLELRSKLVADDSISAVAAKIANDIANAMEPAFKSMLERVFKDFGQTASTINLPQASGGAGPNVPEASATSGIHASTDSGMQAAIEESKMHARQTRYQAFEQYVKEKYQDPAYMSRAMLEKQSAKYATGGIAYDPEYSATNVALMMQKAQKAGVDVYEKLTPQERETFAKAAELKQGKIESVYKSGREEQERYASQISAIQKEEGALKQYLDELRANSEKANEVFEKLPEQLRSVIEKGSEPERELLRLEQESIKRQQEAKDAQEAVSAEIARLKIEKAALDAPAIDEDERIRAKKAHEVAGNIELAQRLAAMAGMAGAVGQFALERPYALEEAKVARAAMERGGARALMSGDMSRYSIIRELGGESDLMTRSKVQAQSTYGIQAGIAGAGGLAAAYTGLAPFFAGTGPVGWAALGIGAAGLGAASYMGYKGLVEPDEKAKEYYEREISARYGQSQELRQAAASSENRLKTSFITARNLGDVGLEAMLYGGSTSNKTSDQIANLIDAKLEKEKKGRLEMLAGFAGEFSAGDDSLKSKEKRESLLEQAKVSKKPEEMEYYKRGLVFDKTGRPVDLNTYAASMGVDYSEIGAPMAAAFGRKFTAEFGQQAINLKTLGISPETIAAMAQGGIGQRAGIEGAANMQDPREAFNRVRDLYAEAFSAGIEKSQLPRALMAVAQQAAQIGLGGAAQAGRQFTTSAAGAREIFGEGFKEEQRQEILDVQKFAMGAGGSFGGGGIGGAMRFLGAQRMLQKIKVGGRPLSSYFKNPALAAEALSKGGASAEGIRELLKSETNMTQEQMKETEEYFASQEKAPGDYTFEERISRGLAKEIDRKTLEGMPEELRETMKVLVGLKAPTTDKRTIATKILDEKRLERLTEGTEITPEGSAASRGGVPPTTPGGKVVSSELAVKAAELNSAIAKVIETTPLFTKAMTDTIKAINEGLNVVTGTKSGANPLNVGNE